MSSSRTDNSIIAERYATALFSLAEKDSALDAVSADLTALAAAIREDGEIVRLLAHPLIKSAGKAEAMRELLKSKKAHALTLQGVGQIAEAGRLALLPEISDAFGLKLNEARGIVNAVVTTARPLNKADVAAVTKALQDALGKDVKLTLKEDASLIGGLKVKLGSRELDMSFSAKMDQLKRALLAA